MVVTIRIAKESDANAVLNIYKPYVEKTAITFDYDIPSLENFKNRMKDIQSRYPFLVAEESGVILGYSYAAPFHPRAAYAWSCEVSIYLEESCRGRGIGQQLYQSLESYLRQMGFLNLNACLASSSIETPYLTQASQHFHEKLGFKKVGTFHHSGYKFQHWFDMIWMEKMIGEHTRQVTLPKSIHDILDLHQKEESDENTCHR